MTSLDLDAILSACNRGTAGPLEWFALADYRLDQGRDDDAECCRIVGEAIESGRLQREQMGPRGRAWCRAAGQHVEGWMMEEVIHVDVLVCREVHVDPSHVYRWHGIPREAPNYGVLHDHEEKDGIVRVRLGAPLVCYDVLGGVVTAFMHPADVFMHVGCE